MGPYGSAENDPRSDPGAASIRPTGAPALGPEEPQHCVSTEACYKAKSRGAGKMLRKFRANFDWDKRDNDFATLSIAYALLPSCTLPIAFCLPFSILLFHVPFVPLVPIEN